MDDYLYSESSAGSHLQVQGVGVGYFGLLLDTAVGVSLPVGIVGVVVDIRRVLLVGSEHIEWHAHLARAFIIVIADS